MVPYAWPRLIKKSSEKIDFQAETLSKQQFSVNNNPEQTRQLLEQDGILHILNATNLEPVAKDLDAAAAALEAIATPSMWLPAKEITSPGDFTQGIILNRICVIEDLVQSCKRVHKGGRAGSEVPPLVTTRRGLWCISYHEPWWTAGTSWKKHSCHASYRHYKGRDTNIVLA